MRQRRRASEVNRLGRVLEAAYRLYLVRRLAAVVEVAAPLDGRRLVGQVAAQVDAAPLGRRQQQRAQQQPQRVVAEAAHLAAVDVIVERERRRPRP